MSTNLSPYSTFRVDPKNVLTFTPPGFKQALNVKFPDSRLPVCVSCKKNFKTKDMCRVRNQHTRPPWTTAYICMTIDDSCTDEDGKYVDKPFVVRMVQWRPFCVMEDFPPKSKVPVCATCKKTNRTRSFCRDRHKHRKLPWCTVYVMLSTQESVDPSTVTAAPSTKIEEPIENTNEVMGTKQKAIESSTIVKESLAPLQIETVEGKEHFSVCREVTSSPSDTPKVPSGTGGDDINEIPESRTMLIQINDQETTISWLKLLPEDDSASKGYWLQQPQVPTQEQKFPKFAYPPVAPATVRAPKRTVESLSQHSPTDPSMDVYHHHALSGYNTTDGNEPPHHPYPYHSLTPMHKDTIQPPQYSGYGWAYPATAIPSHPLPHSHAYVTTQQRAISPAPDIGSPVAVLRASSRSPSVTAGEAAAMQRKKPRHEYEQDCSSEAQHLNPIAPSSGSSGPQLQHPLGNFGHVPHVPGHPLPGPPPTDQQIQHHSTHIQHEQQSWMLYPHMYQASMQPVHTHYPTDPSSMNLRTPESSRSLQHQDESPNNVTMTPGPGDGGGDHDSDDPDFNRQSLL
eukprot:jgi/Psemu1/187123/e_gw1.65.34.1